MLLAAGLRTFIVSLFLMTVEIRINYINLKVECGEQLMKH